jgi:hypothetical protein
VLSIVISLLLQYSLVISLTAVPGDKSSIKRNRAQQEPSRPVPPTPGMGTGGNGPGGSFNVDPPERLLGPPSGVRNIAEVTTEARTPPQIPDPIPSTEGYCWPGDPACRKRPPTAKPRTPAPKPTPPPRPQRASVLRPELMVASNGGYVERLLSGAVPYLSHLWNSDDLLPPEPRDPVYS